MINNKKKLNRLIPDPKALCNISTSLYVTGGTQADSLNVNSTTSLEENTYMSSLDVKGIGTLQGTLSVSGLSNLGNSSICNGNVNVQNSSITGLSSPENGSDAVNYSYYLNSLQDVFQYVSSQYGKNYFWGEETLLDWQALKDATYETENAGKMLSFQGNVLQILLPGTYQINISFNKGQGYNETGGQMNLILSGKGSSNSSIAIGNNYTQFVTGWGNASISNCLGAMFSVSENDVQSGTYLTLENLSGGYNLTYFNYRIIRYAFL